MKIHLNFFMNILFSCFYITSSGNPHNFIIKDDFHMLYFCSHGDLFSWSGVSPLYRSSLYQFLELSCSMEKSSPYSMLLFHQIKLCIPCFIHFRSFFQPFIIMPCVCIHQYSQEHSLF